MNAKNYLIDTSVILEGPEYIINAIKDGGNIYITDIILQELDGKKGEEDKTGYNARSFFRAMGKDDGTAYYTIPGTDASLQRGDSLRKMSLFIKEKHIPVYVFVRSNYKTRNINDSKIIEVAKDYGLTLLTRDMAQKVRALSEGVGAEIVELLEKENKKITWDEKAFIALIYVLTSSIFIAFNKNFLDGSIFAGFFFGTIATILYLSWRGKEELLERYLKRQDNKKKEFGEGWAYMSCESPFRTGPKWID